MSARKRRSVSSADIAIFRASLFNLVRKQETIVVADRTGAKDLKRKIENLHHDLGCASGPTSEKVKGGCCMLSIHA